MRTQNIYNYIEADYKKSQVILNFNRCIVLRALGILSISSPFNRTFENKVPLIIVLTFLIVILTASYMCAIATTQEP